MPIYIDEREVVSEMQRYEVKDEYAKITRDHIEQLDGDSYTEIKNSMDSIAKLEEKIELYLREKNYENMC